MKLVWLVFAAAMLSGCDYKGNPVSGPSACSSLAVDLHRDYMFGIGVMDFESQGYYVRECYQSGSNAGRAELMKEMRDDYMEWVRKEVRKERYGDE